MKKELSDDLKILEDEENGSPILAGIAALRGNKEKMITYINASLKKGQLSVDQIEIYPVFEDFREDEDLINIIKKKNEELEYR